MYVDIKQKHNSDVFVEICRADPFTKLKQRYPMYNKISQIYLCDVVMVSKKTVKFSELNEAIAYLDRSCSLDVYKRILASYWNKRDLERGKEFLENLQYDIMTFARLDLTSFPFVFENELPSENDVNTPSVSGQKRLIQNALAL
jgi:hypothetical protein